MPIQMPVMTAAQERAWHGLFDLAKKFPEGWTLIGGQLVHLHCVERGVLPHRSTPDVDTVVDARRYPEIFTTLTQHLEGIGFHVQGETMGGKHHRWVRGAASVDVLIPSGLGGGRTASAKSASGRPGLETPGAQYALARTELVEVAVGERTGRIPRPTLVGGLIMKAAAWGNTLDTGRDRHLDGICMLASMLSRVDLISADLGKGEKRYLRYAITPAAEYDRAGEIDGAVDGLRRLDRIVGSR